MNFKIIPAEKKHLPAMAALLSPTGFWRIGLEKNTLGLDYETFATRFVLEPLLPHTVVAVGYEDPDTVQGFLTCGKKDVIDAIPSYREYYNPQIMEWFSPIAQLELPEGYVIPFLSVDPRFRCQNIGMNLFKYAEDKAEGAHCDTISLIVWAFNRDAIRFYLNRGMLISGSISLEAPVFSTLLRMEKSPRIAQRINFFETEEYKGFHLV